MQYFLNDRSLLSSCYGILANGKCHSCDKQLLCCLLNWDVEVCSKMFTVAICFVSRATIMASRSSSEDEQSLLPRSSKGEVATTRHDLCDVCDHKTNASSSIMKNERLPPSDDFKLDERTSHAPLSKGVTRSSECRSLPENSTSSQALYPSLPKYQDHGTFKSTPSASYRKEEDMM